MTTTDKPIGTVSTKKPNNKKNIVTILDTTTKHKVYGLNVDVGKPTVKRWKLDRTRLERSIHIKLKSNIQLTYFKFRSCGFCREKYTFIMFMYDGAPCHIAKKRQFIYKVGFELLFVRAQIKG